MNSHRSSGRLAAQIGAWLVAAVVLAAAVGSAQAETDPLAAPASPQGSTSAPEADSVAAAAASGRTRVERAWFGAGADLGARASALRLEALAMGADDMEGASRALIAPGAGDPSSALSRSLTAVNLSPDLPSARMVAARALWNEGERVQALEQVVAGLWAIPHHVEASLWLVSSLLTMLVTVMVCGSLAFIVLAGLRVFSHAAHDLGDLVAHSLPSFAGAALLGSLLLIPLIFGEGLFGMILVLLCLGVAYGDARHRMALTLAGVLVVIGMYPLVQVAGRALDAIQADPVATAALMVVRDSASEADVEVLRRVEDEDTLAAHALALRARRVGDEEAAFQRYTALRERNPRDAVVLANLGNLHFRRGDVETAVGFYEKAALLEDSPRLLFNLSQAYARLFRMEEFEKALQLAQSTGADEVAELSRLGDPDFVADLPMPLGDLGMRLVQASRGDAFAAVVSAPIAPGRLGESWLHAAGALVVAALLGSLLSGRYERSSRCRRCGVRICARCDGTVWNSDTCDGCHLLFHRPEATDASLRMARLTALRNRETRVGRLSLLASLLIPGMGGLLARRPDLAFVGLLFAAWAAVTFAWRGGVVPDPLAVGAAGPLAFILTGVFCLAGYLVVVTWGWLIRRSL
ncbi:MAG: tetratricopeptide repeat protein [Myxococcota bacterium]